jgi:hypothetical protein
MQIIKTLTSYLFFFLPVVLCAQSTYLQPGSKDAYLVDRLEIKAANPNLNYSTIKPYNRRKVVTEIEIMDSLYRINDYKAPKLSKIDRYNIEHFLMGNSEWATPRESFISKKPIFNTFYKTRANLLEINNPNFFLVVNPLLTYQQSFEKNNSQNIFYNSRGVALRGMIDSRIGFHIYFTENQERDPLYVQRYISDTTYTQLGLSSPLVNLRAVPGAGFYKSFKKTAVDYFDVRGSITWNVAKFIDMQFGYDKNFIGAGFRSLFLSNFSNNATFLKINTRIWKFNYQNLYMELIPQYGKPKGDELLSRKYFRMNHLSMNFGKTVNIGIFDAVVFGRKDHFDFQYLLPVMFLRPAEQQVGSPDNAILGLDAKVNIFKTFQLYGQLMFDEFVLGELKRNRGFWANKYGYQLGAKYIDAFGVKNMDIQIEANRIRPFTYSHFDSVANYTHYNMPLAHPLGANFQEFIAIVRAQPYPKVYLQFKIFYSKQGLDSNGVNFGANPLRDYREREVDLTTVSRLREFGYNVGSGNKATTVNANFLASYEFKENLFFDLSAQFRNVQYELGGNTNTTVISAAIRWNMARRDFDF